MKISRNFEERSSVYRQITRVNIIVKVISTGDAPNRHHERIAESVIS